MSVDASLALRAAASALAATWIDPPVLQPAGLYLELAGEDIRARAYMLAGDDDAALCLRPDMTAPAVREALKRNDWSAAFGLAYDGLVFRRQTDNAKESEFRQIGAEVFAPVTDIASREADITIAALDACRAVGVQPRMRLGDVAVFEAIVDACALPESWTRRVKRAFSRPGGLATVLREAAAPPAPEESILGEALAALPDERAEAVVEELLADARIVLVGGRTVAEIAARLREKGRAMHAPRADAQALALIAEATAIEAAPDAAFEQLRKIAARPSAKNPTALLAAIDRASARWDAVKRDNAPEATFSAGFGRGLAYYDGFVFELEAPLLGVRASLGGGGRYDGLLQRITSSQGSGPPASWGAAGFAMRPARLAEAAQ
ncbi:MAG: ATP phosphoribosyltransferase regulatory subunit [Alphaproteobacteria bacterium]|nr:ATP phosphoribosyltransferase regulatory subunit [Alphaproteobacteria bacterium]